MKGKKIMAEKTRARQTAQLVFFYFLYSPARSLAHGRTLPPHMSWHTSTLLFVRLHALTHIPFITYLVISWHTYLPLPSARQFRIPYTFLIHSHLSQTGLPKVIVVIPFIVFPVIAIPIIVIITIISARIQLIVAFVTHAI